MNTERIQQIADNTNFTLDELIETLKAYGNLPEYMASHENLPGTHYDRYFYLWRNLFPRFSSEHIKYELNLK